MKRVLLGMLIGFAPLALAARSDDTLVKQLDNEVIALKQRIAALNEVVEECGGGKAPDPIFPELVQLYSGTQVTVKRRGGRTLVVIPVDLLFPNDSLAIREEATFALDMVSTALNTHVDMSVLVTGHTDNEQPPPLLRKRYTSNWELSTAYANAVGTALMNEYKLDPARVTIAGRADQDPNDTNDTPEGRAANRRVVLTLSPGKYP